MFRFTPADSTHLYILHIPFFSYGHIWFPYKNLLHIHAYRGTGMALSIKGEIILL